MPTSSQEAHATNRHGEHHALALHFRHYNFVRIHKSLRVRPAMKAGIASHPWTLGDIVALLD